MSMRIDRSALRHTAWATVVVRGLVVLGLCALVAGPAAGHPGHDHTIMGTVKAIKDGQVEIEAKDGKVVAVRLASTTKILRGATKATAADIAVGQRIVVIATSPGGAAPSALVAKEIRLAVKAPTE